MRFFICGLVWASFSHVAHCFAHRASQTVQYAHDINWGFGGIATFGQCPYHNCLTTPDLQFDIAVIGAPFDTGATYRPGARLGPRSIRAASTRHTRERAFNSYTGLNPYSSWARVIDCGDIPVTPLDNGLAIDQMTSALLSIGNHPTASTKHHKYPKLIVLGGDHTVSLPALRALKEIHQSPLALLHFDAHLDTLKADAYPGSDQPSKDLFSHGMVFRRAYEEGLLAQGASLHVGLNARLSGDSFADFEEDEKMGFTRIIADDIDEIGAEGVIDAIRTRFNRTTYPVYISIDIDVLDPAYASGTGAPEAGGWSTRELLRVLRGVENSLNVVGADVVEVSPPYDSPGMDTAFVAASLVFELISKMVSRGASSTQENGLFGGGNEEL